MTAEDEIATGALRARMGRALDGFAGGLPPGWDPSSLRIGRPDPKLFPVPELVLVALRDVMGFEWSGAGEKVRWTVHANVGGEPFGFALRRFGLAIDHREGVAEALVGRVQNQLSGSLRLLEPALAAYARRQLADGNLTMSNRMPEFDARYRYFRELADKAFAPVPLSFVPLGAGRDAAVLVEWDLDRERRGYFASGAMVDAYFSGLEHRALLLRAFTGRPLARGDFEAFVAMRWDARLRDLGGIGGGLLGRLREVKSTIRNPLSHGGVRNDGGAFHFHLPGVGAVPANLSRFRDRLRVSVDPIAAAGHSELCALFDEVDAVLRDGELALPGEFVRAGTDPQFDAAALARYGTALAGGKEAVAALVERLGREWERHANMDY